MVEHIEKRISCNFGSVNTARTVKERKKVRESSVGAGEVEEKGDMLQNMGHA